MSDLQTTEMDAERLARRPDAEELVGSISNHLDAERRRRAEFYDWLDEDKSAEFIDGQIHVHSPVVKRHADATMNLTALLRPYALINNLGYVATEKLLVRLRRNDFEPDVAFWTTEVADTFTDDQLFFPAPAFVAEVLSPGTEDIDRDKKFKAYAQAGVKEYWIVDSKHHQVEQYTLGKRGTYGKARILTPPDRIAAVAIPGFEVPTSALFDAQANLATLSELLAPPPAKA